LGLAIGVRHRKSHFKVVIIIRLSACGFDNCWITTVTICDRLCWRSVGIFDSCFPGLSMVWWYFQHEPTNRMGKHWLTLPMDCRECRDS
jgi:hypothetical protein